MMKIYHYVGAGNSFVILPDFEESLATEALPDIARRLCGEEGFPVDGLMVLRKPQEGGACRMLFYNNDGSTAEMCGNGARCLCRFCHDHGLAGEKQVLETPAGLVTGERLGENSYRIRLNSPTVLRYEEDLSYLELGDPGIPHAVVAANLSADRGELREFARTLRHSPRFPRGANVNLYEIAGENRLRLLTFERGVEDFTLACGTGTGATVAALALLGKVAGRCTEVLCEGGTLWVDVAEDQIFLTGPAEALGSKEIEL